MDLVVIPEESTDPSSKLMIRKQSTIHQITNNIGSKNSKLNQGSGTVMGSPLGSENNSIQGSHHGFQKF